MNNRNNHVSDGKLGLYGRFIPMLFLIVAGIFTFLSSTGCGEPTTGCGPISGSDYSSGRSVNAPPFSLSTSTGSSDGAQQREPGSLSVTTVVSPGSRITREISYSTTPGNDPTSIVWTPPDGASNFSFNHAPLPGGPPFVFNNVPPLTLPIQIMYDAPLLPSYWDNRVVGEVIRASKAGNTDDIHVLNYIISRSGSLAQSALPFAQTSPLGDRGGISSSSIFQTDPSQSTAIAAKEVQHWYGVPGKTMDTALCQELFDWLQSDQTFGAVRLPVSIGSDPSYDLPVLFPASGALGTPKIRLESNGVLVAGTPILPLEVRSDRISFMENVLPSVNGEHWVALGVDSTNKVTCPAGLNLLNWEFFVEYPVNPAVPIDTFPLYYCQDGQNPPPIGLTALSLLANQKVDVHAPGIQLEGVTCLGPYAQNINTNPVIYVGHPNTVWNKLPLDEIRLQHYVQVIGLAPTINFIISSNISGLGWKLYEGDENAPNLSKEVDITKPYTALPTMMFFWMIGTVPGGTRPGSYTVSLRVENNTKPAEYGASTDLIWVGQWVEPPLPGSNPNFFYLSIIKR
jgi:hypothetical protein